ncbi:MAG: tyrosine-type recombinase/integrase [Desulfobacterales bacterium]|nr:tyrosine-type recombinase/integrase [Desulfobacterales bacterium]
MKQYVQWAREAGVSLELPFKEHDMCMFISRRSHKVKYITISGNFSAIRKYHIERGFPWERDMFPVLKNMFKGLFRESGQSFSDRRPITVEILLKFLSLLDTTKYDHLVSATFLTLAVQALLRVSEYTEVPGNPSENRPLRIGHIHFKPDGPVIPHMAIIELKTEKSARGATGRKISIGRTGHPSGACAIRLLQQMLHRRKILFNKKKLESLSLKKNSHLFVWENGSLVTSRDVNTVIQGCVKNLKLEEKYTSHSLREGGASSLAQRNVQDTQIAQLGRWKEMYVMVRYTKMSLEQMAGLSHAMFCLPMKNPMIVFSFSKYKF